MDAMDKMVLAFESEFIEGYAERWRHLLSLTESPIERLFVAAILSQFYQPHLLSEPCRPLAEEWADIARGFGIFAIGGRKMIPQQWPNLADATHGKTGESCAAIYIQPSVHLKNRNIRMDVVLLGKRAGRVVMVCVELDGHEFHERTKAQAIRDKSRDRALQEVGWVVLRYSGSEVFRDPHGCSSDAMRVLSKRLSARENPGQFLDDLGLFIDGGADA